jgi:hypothetical protein
MATFLDGLVDNGDLVREQSGVGQISARFCAGHARGQYLLDQSGLSKTGRICLGCLRLAGLPEPN